MATPTSIEELNLHGGHLALDFANTLYGPRDGEPTDDFLSSYGDLVSWARRVGTLPARVRPPGGAADVEWARDLRATIHDVFAAVAVGEAPRPRSLRHLLAVHAEAVAQGTLADGDWVWSGTCTDRPLWPVAVAAVDLLRSEYLDRVKLCAACRWLFLDRSRNGSRRWCSMDECGVHAKMRRYRAARRGG